MKLPQAAPGEGGRNEYENWSYWSVKPGEDHFAYVAGYCKWFVCHPSERTKPCLHWFTKGELPCKLCAKEKFTAEVGYLPVWRGTDWRPKLVVLYAPEREHVDRLRLHQRILVGRERESGAQVFVRVAANQEPAFNTTREERKRPADITNTLLTLWGIGELVVWLVGTGRVSDTVLSLDNDASAEQGSGEPATSHKPDAQPYTGPDPLHAAAALDGAVNRLTEHAAKWDAEPSANGKHKPKG